MTKDDYLVYAEHVKKYFPVSGEGLRTVWLKAVDDVTFGIRAGETFGLVGESGCGKSTLAQVILRLLTATDGAVYINGRDLLRMKKRELKQMRRQMQIVFQDPYDSLNPRMTLEQIITEPLTVHHIGDRRSRHEQALKLMSMVGLPESQLERYPHQLSGGQRQRVSIARSLALSPKLIVCDEAVSALDVSIQAQILNILSDLKRNLGLTYLFVSHDLSVVRFISDRIGVMYFGHLVEVAEKDELFDHCLHPYTTALLSAIPNPDPTQRRRRIPLKGEVPSLIHPPKGCIFCGRCAYVRDRCREEMPGLEEAGNGHQVACFRWREFSLSETGGAEA